MFRWVCGLWRRSPPRTRPGSLQVDPLVHLADGCEASDGQRDTPFHERSGSRERVGRLDSRVLLAGQPSVTCWMEDDGSIG